MEKSYQLRIDYAKDMSPEFKIHLKKRVIEIINNFYNKEYKDIINNHLLSINASVDADYVFEYDLIYYVYIVLKHVDKYDISFLIRGESNNISMLFNLLNLDINE